MLYITVLIAAIWANAVSSANLGRYWFADNFDDRQTLKDFCETSVSDIVVITFWDTYGEDIRNITDFCVKRRDTSFSTCSQIGEDIKLCQKMGKEVLLGMEVHPGLLVFNNVTIAEETAENYIKSLEVVPGIDTPFGNAKVDGFHILNTDYNVRPITSFAAKLRQLTPTKKLSTMVRCSSREAFLPFLEEIKFDYVFITFYYHECALNGDFNWDEWSEYAKKSAPKNTKFYVALHGHLTIPIRAYVDINTVEHKFPKFSNDPAFGGFVIFQASRSSGNVDYANQVAKLLHHDKEE